MTTLYNQTKAALSWDMSGRAFSCEAWGAVDIPEKLLGACKSRGLPLAAVPVPPEHRAQQRIVDEQAAAKSDALRALKMQADSAQAEKLAACEELEKVQAKLGEVRRQLRESNEELESVKRDLASAHADKKAAEDLLAETAKAATDAEERAIKAEARLAEAKKTKRGGE